MRRLISEIRKYFSDVNCSSTAQVTIILRDQTEAGPQTGEPGCHCGQKKNVIQVMFDELNSTFYFKTKPTRPQSSEETSLR